MAISLSISKEEELEPLELLECSGAGYEEEDKMEGPEGNGLNFDESATQALNRD